MGEGNSTKIFCHNSYLLLFPDCVIDLTTRAKVYHEAHGDNLGGEDVKYEDAMTYL